MIRRQGVWLRWRRDRCLAQSVFGGLVAFDSSYRRQRDICGLYLQTLPFRVTDCKGKSNVYLEKLYFFLCFFLCSTKSNKRVRTNALWHAKPDPFLFHNIYSCWGHSIISQHLSNLGDVSEKQIIRTNNFRLADVTSKSVTDQKTKKNKKKGKKNRNERMTWSSAISKQSLVMRSFANNFNESEDCTWGQSQQECSMCAWRSYITLLAWYLPSQNAYTFECENVRSIVKRNFKEWQLTYGC